MRKWSRSSGLVLREATWSHTPDFARCQENGENRVRRCPEAGGTQGKPARGPGHSGSVSVLETESGSSSRSPEPVRHHGPRARSRVPVPTRLSGTRKGSARHPLPPALSEDRTGSPVPSLPQGRPVATPLPARPRPQAWPQGCSGEGEAPPAEPQSARMAQLSPKAPAPFCLRDLHATLRPGKAVSLQRSACEEEPLLERLGLEGESAPRPSLLRRMVCIVGAEMTRASSFPRNHE